jgi:hypothetical protein
VAKFERPQNSIEDVAELQVGDRIWHVCGIWPPQMGGDHVVTRAAIPLQDHPKNRNPSSQDASLVFDTRWSGSDLSHMEFASDGNMIRGYSHNDNYWFRDEAAASAAVEFLRAQWEAAPDKIKEEIARREEDCRFYEAFAD